MECLFRYCGTAIPFCGIIQLLSLHHTDRLNSDTSAADNFDMLELFFDKLDDRVIFGCGLDEFQKEVFFP